ncbi:putative type II secretion system protein D precursor [bacterium BMS3Abin07]|nr:putative type II secretion system protein D precursor [bacterium BMS3Abin07]GBE32821.1 putative type II secretion system protein D precursor [bacterium BMS3Bbin05]
MRNISVLFRVICLLLCVFSLLPAAVAHADTAKTVTFNFVDVDLPVVAKYVSDVTGKNFIFDEKFKGKVTIIAPTKLNSKDGFKLFTSVLELKGFTVIPAGVNAYKIIPASMARQKGMAVSKKGAVVNESYIARLLQLKYISSDEAVRFLKPVVSRDGYISSFGPGNLVLAIDSGMNIKKILSIIGIIDRPSTVEVPEIVFLKYAGAEDVAAILNEGTKFNAGVVKGRRAAASSSRVIADTRLNAVVIFGPRATRESLKRLLSILDVPSEESQGRINVYFLENADAEDIAKVMQGVVKGIEQTKKKVQRIGRPAGRNNQDIIITPDKSSNSLVIMASPADYKNIVSVIKKLDRRKKQVYVEAMIVEASINNLMELGSKWRAIARHNGNPVVIGGVGIMDSTALQSVISGLTGLSIGGMGNFFDIPITTIGTDGTVTTSNLTVPGFSALFSLQKFKGAIDVLSTPQILTSDNKEAEIVVGENVPFVKRRESNPSANASVFTDIDREDVGIKLKITPHIAEGDYVSLDVYQEISSVKQESNANILISLGPTTTKRSTRTSVIVKDNQTVVIGGLMEEKKEVNVTKVPLLGDIPILGWLFKFKTTNKQKTNLLVFITPHIVKDSEELAMLTNKKGKDYARAANMYVSGQLLIRFKPGTGRDRIDSIMKKEGASIVSYIKNLDVYVVNIRRGSNVEDAVSDFLSYSEVRYAEPNYQFRIQNSGQDNNTDGKQDFYILPGVSEDEGY